MANSMIVNSGNYFLIFSMSDIQEVSGRESQNEEVNPKSAGNKVLAVPPSFLARWVFFLCFSIFGILTREKCIQDESETCFLILT